MRASLRFLTALLWLAAVPAFADGWEVGTGPGVLADPGDDPATRIGGWFDASYEDNDREPSAGGFNHVNGYADTRWRSFQGFVEIEYEHELDLDGYEAENQFELEQAYVRWQANDALSLRAGRFNTAFGWWVPIHWEILMDSVTPPLYVGNELVPEQQIGVELAGRHFPGDLAGFDTELDWSLFAGYGNKGLDEDRTDGVSVGGDLRLHLAERFLLGVSGYRQRNRALANRTEQSGVVYGEAHLPFALTLRSEYTFSNRDTPDQIHGTPSQLERNTDAVYAALRWDAHRFAYLAYRFGYGDQDDEETLVTGDRTIHTITLGVLPRPDVRIKLEYNHNELAGGIGPDFDHWVASVGYLF